MISKTIATVFYTLIFAHINNVPYDCLGVWMEHISLPDAIFSLEENISLEYPALFVTSVLIFSIT